MQITLAHGTSTVSRRLTGSHAQALNPSWVAASRQSPLAGNAMLLTPAARQHNPVSSTTECVCLHHTCRDVSIISARSMTAKVSDFASRVNYSVWTSHQQGGSGRMLCWAPPVVSGPAVSMSSDVSRSHHLTVRSAELVAIMNSEGWYSMAVMASSCLNSCSSLPAVRSHTYTYTTCKMTVSTVYT